jgi:hypothetical protein
MLRLAALAAGAALGGGPGEGCPGGAIRLDAAGRGNAPKEAMIAAARAHGFNPGDDNEADALAILFWALETRGGLR